ncbi:Ribosomal RNA-processing protein 8 [Trachymyrmex zeteki]|uniref:Ribosomal RNA-processing protein 8 n=1 Tax=Mycetomoellerius zeteki TaxID=64791 RepID=A0A151XJJ4_9HYME|nr:Ribosomal RNA-processing protein 8 [Trachymyrmex zeteki]
MQNNKRKKSYDSKNELDAKYTENSDSLTKYSKNNKNNIKKLSISNEITKDIFTNMQKSKKKKLRDLKKNKLDAKYIENANAPTNYPKDDKKTISKVQNNSNIKIKCEKNKKRKQDMNLNPTNKNDVRINEDDEDDSSEDNGSKSIKKKEEKLKKLQMEMSTKVETQQIQSDILKLNKHKINIKYLKKMLENKLQVTKVTQSTLRDKKLTLRDRMQMQLKASRFRFINETLYNNDSSQSKHYFQKEPDSFMAYHAGYKQQIEQWPINPLDVIISSIKKLYCLNNCRPTDNAIADFGCGEARLAASVPHTVHSFDFIALNDKVKACDMIHTPLLMNSVHVVVFCLSLMGSNLNDYIIEANRVLKNNGILKIAEVESRFEDVKDFIRLLRHYGFKNTWKDLSHNLFYFMDFKKDEDISMKRKNLPPITLKSCAYKKR